MKTKLNKTKNVSIYILLLVYGLVIFGVIMVYSASMFSASVYFNNKYYFLYKQIIGVILGSIALTVTYFVDYNVYQKYKWWMVVIAFIFLVAVFIPGVGVSNYGAKRWIGLPGFTIQASEVAKFCFIIFCASYLAQNYDKVKTFKGILPIVLVGGSVCLMILLEPNMSITICVGLVMLIMLFVGGIKLKHFLLLCIPALLLVPILIIIEPYRLQRLMAFIDPWANPQGEGYQLIQSLYSLGSGGLFGVGLFNSRQKYLFLPFAESDFIFSIIAEELGLLGSILLILTFFLLLLCGIRVALNSTNRFGCYLATGIISLISVQVLVNIAVVTGSIPPTGLPLPFISAGSSSIIVLMASIGILLNINKQSINGQKLLNGSPNDKKHLKKIKFIKHKKPS